MDHETALYQMNSEENLFWGGGGKVYFYFQKRFSLESGNSFTRNRRSAFIVISDRFRITSINTELTTFKLSNK